jgi:predicted O-methyltransferase YrrM
VEFEELMNGLAGGISAAEGALLQRLAAGLARGCIVEVGSYRGKSAVALALGVRDNEAEPRPAIFCIEPHQPFVGYYGGTFGPADRRAFYETMCRTGAFNEVALINLSSEEVAPLWHRQVGLVFIDGDHRYPAVRRDFELWDPHLPAGGLVAFDDATDPGGGPYRLIGEILQDGHYQSIETVGKIEVLKKIGVT